MSGDAGRCSQTPGMSLLFATSSLDDASSGPDLRHLVCGVLPPAMPVPRHATSWPVFMHPSRALPRTCLQCVEKHRQVRKSSSSKTAALLGGRTAHTPVCAPVTSAWKRAGSAIPTMRTGDWGSKRVTKTAGGRFLAQHQVPCNVQTSTLRTLRSGMRWRGQSCAARRRETESRAACSAIGCAVACPSEASRPGRQRQCTPHVMCGLFAPDVRPFLRAHWR